MQQAASYLQQAFGGQHHAWFGGWALKLRGPNRDTRDLNLLVQARDVDELRATLSPYSWAITSDYEMADSDRERIFVDVGEEGQLVDQPDTPLVGQEDSYESIQTPEVEQVPVVPLKRQVEKKLGKWILRKKQSDFQDLEFLFRANGQAIKEWAEHLNLEWRIEFYEAYKTAYGDRKARNAMKSTLKLGWNGGSSLFGWILGLVLVSWETF
ncbi:hypothetical protein FALBO_16824 [Fusarium albosuccineum]|uniref:Nucleotidyltransferase family protein n=1 Tax=Fusarium albosuccineum TaxID=1237068 RepID=A0A8H4KDK1_9HYPO|nr:hypothetical protein FALBO_16824 [Fusarium albosuccineum]